MAWNGCNAWKGDSYPGAFRLTPSARFSTVLNNSERVMPNPLAIFANAENAAGRWTSGGVIAHRHAGATDTWTIAVRLECG